MTLEDIFQNAADQDRGRLLIVSDPWSGESAGITFRVAGPDSQIQYRARIAMMDRLAELAEADGTVTAANREKARLECLASCVLAMEVEEDGQKLALTQKNIIRVLSSAAWLQAQVDAFAGDRSRFAPGASDDA
jgi:hypothetical protein